MCFSFRLASARVLFSIKPPLKGLGLFAMKLLEALMRGGFFETRQSLCNLIDGCLIAAHRFLQLVEVLPFNPVFAASCFAML